jgi:hypothetical protein
MAEEFSLRLASCHLEKKEIVSEKLCVLVPETMRDTKIFFTSVNNG